MNTFTKKYQLWREHSDQNGYFIFTECDSLSEAILAPKTGDWYITKAANVQITDPDEAKPPFPFHVPGVRSLQDSSSAELTYVQTPLPPEIRGDEEDLSPEALAYLNGGTGNLTPSSNP